MTTRIVRVGNTLSVEIPEELVVQAALPVGEPVEWVPAAGGIALVRQANSVSSSKPMTIDDLLEGIPEGAAMEEIDWGPPRGVEVW
jgi:antitoxin component of MazEF toxin-antitoxin module